MLWLRASYFYLFICSPACHNVAVNVDDWVSSNFVCHTCFVYFFNLRWVWMISPEILSSCLHWKWIPRNMKSLKLFKKLLLYLLRILSDIQEHFSFQNIQSFLKCWKLILLLWVCFYTFQPIRKFKALHRALNLS